jgi:hypothetical protein
MKDINIILLICVIVEFITILICIYNNKVDKSIINRQNITIEKLEYHLNSRETHIGKLNTLNDELKAELHSIKFPVNNTSTDYTSFSVLAKKNGVKWYKLKVEQILNWLDKNYNTDVIGDAFNKLIVYNEGYSNTELPRVPYYSLPKNRDEFTVVIDTLENKLSKSIVDIIKE